MDIVTTVTDLLFAKKKFSTAPVLVPTMGALHAGHLSLIAKARDIAGPNGCVAVSIFVNPIQFDNAGDLAAYPSTLERDIELCKEHGVDLLFTPSVDSLYASDRSILVSEGALATKLCGASRPGHFDGVCTIVAKLFNLFTPIDAVFGKKDYQQLAIINRMVRDLNFPIIIHGVDTMREPDGLAMSSRNVRLSETERSHTPAIYQALKLAQQQLENGETNACELLKIVREHLSQHAPEAVIDYLECVDAVSLESVELVSKRSVIAIAAFFGEVRLIDNVELFPTI